MGRSLGKKSAPSLMNWSSPFQSKPEKLSKCNFSLFSVYVFLALSINMLLWALSLLKLDSFLSLTSTTPENSRSEFNHTHTNPKIKLTFIKKKIAILVFRNPLFRIWIHSANTTILCFSSIPRFDLSREAQGVDFSKWSVFSGSIFFFAHIYLIFLISFLLLKKIQWDYETFVWCVRPCI
jgi:uncharacterized ion transporter superfamily protein YfcC